jgi:hypothetical protein
VSERAAPVGLGLPSSGFGLPGHLPLPLLPIPPILLGEITLVLDSVRSISACGHGPRPSPQAGRFGGLLILTVSLEPFEGFTGVFRDDLGTDTPSRFRRSESPSSQPRM